MTTALAPEVEVPEAPAISFQLVAVDQAQLAHAQDELISWSEHAQQLVTRELEEQQQVRDHAAAQKWAVAPHDRRIAQLRRRQEFYAKIEGAAREGYVVIPNFEMTAFAIRTKAAKPKARQRDGKWHPNERSQILPAGEGEYKNPSQLITESTETRKRNYGEKESYTQVVSWPSEFQESIEFPIALAKPVLMQRTAMALATKLFDELGVVDDGPRHGRPGDPVIAGRIRNPRPGRPDITFFIGWYFDPSRL